jgi:drug/metabolite transporter (DMT)-like permease
VTAVLLALAAAVCFGAMPVAVRFAFRVDVSAALGTLAMQVTAFAVVAIGALVEGVRLEGLTPFLLAGLVAPGASQIFITLGIREAGSSRASIAFGTAPLFAVLIALVALGERPEAAALAGVCLVVGGGVALAFERDRPAHVRWIGLAYAIVGALLFAIRDNLVRHLSLDTATPPLTAAAATLVSAIVFSTVYAAVRGERAVVPPAGIVRWGLPGVLIGLAYVGLFEAFYRGEISVVAPIVGTESLWGVLLSALLLRRSELVGVRLVGGAALVVAGGVLIAVFR